MVILIAGASHTGKTLLAQKLLEKLHYPYLSMDHLKMGLIRSGNTALTPMDDEQMTPYLWPIVREMIKTAVENGQNLIVEGCYIPHRWTEDFEPDYLEDIRCCWLILSHRYIAEHFADIQRYANAIENRLDDSDLDQQMLLQENAENLAQCEQHGCAYILVDTQYDVREDPILELLNKEE